MIENYILTNLQLDAIGRVCRYASENELRYKQFLCKENGYINANYDFDLGLLNILHQQILELYSLKNISDNSLYYVSLWYAEQTIEALNHSLAFYCLEHMNLEPNRSLIVNQNFPEFEKRIECKTGSCDIYYKIPENKNKYVSDPV